ncbi:DedA family protein [Micromonospora sp. NBRC 110038]|uniref:DedA family protein n=1 Tax=Micromonospora sp. NBRC 110038 TaxID=1550034 RepID=UPI001E419232|nr:DedA family protein [Micromonospora sp. NBRC 110038]
MDISDVLRDRIAELPPGQVLAVAAVVLAAEVGLLVGVVLPAATTMLTVGLLARMGRLDLGTTLAVTTLAAFVGDQLGYLEGRLLGRRIRDGVIGRRIGADRWRRAEALVVARGGPAVLVGRWTAFARTLVPRVAGAAGLPYRRFVLFEGLAVLVWVPGTVLVGYTAGAASAGMLTTIAGGLVVAVAVGVLLRRLRVRRSAARRRPCAGSTRARRAPAARRRLTGQAPNPRRPGPGLTAPATRNTPHPHPCPR